MNTALLKNHYHEEMRDRAAKGLRHMNYVDWKDQKALLAIYFEMKQKEILEETQSKIFQLLLRQTWPLKSAQVHVQRQELL